MQTAVEWLIDKLTESKNEDGIYCTTFLYNFEIAKAKEMEKQQIKDAWFDGYGGSAHSEDEYYNETYK